MFRTDQPKSFPDNHRVVGNDKEATLGDATMRLNRTFLISLSAALLAISTAHADGPEGRWPSGSWFDNNSGHQGPLRGNFRPTNDGNYRAVFKGRFAKVVPFRFATTLHVVGQEGDTTYFAGESKLPLFGRFTYSGTADACHFNMQYDSRRWQGDFNLER
jgi:hypothetical protein